MVKQIIAKLISRRQWKFIFSRKWLNYTRLINIDKQTNIIFKKKITIILNSTSWFIHVICMLPNQSRLYDKTYSKIKEENVSNNFFFFPETQINFFYFQETGKLFQLSLSNYKSVLDWRSKEITDLDERFVILLSLV